LSGLEVLCLKRVGIHSKDELSIQSILEFMKKNERFDEVGGIACFFGFVKKFVKNNEVKGLTLEAYEKKAEKIFSEISEEIRKRPGIVDVAIHHTVGKLKIGELIFVVMVSGRSRKDVFPALVETVERAKRDATIWKKEEVVTGESYWVEYDSN
jgi:molybdopterin synthase catalytic subunit